MLKRLWWYLFSEESSRQWDNRMSAEFRFVRPNVWPFGEFLWRRPWLCLFLHFGILSGILETGVDGLEPIGINWFWAPFLTWLSLGSFDHYPLTRWGVWVWRHPKMAFWIIWAVNALMIPAVIWNGLRQFDAGVAHPLRDLIGRSIGLGGQTGFLLAICGVLALAAIWHEVHIRCAS